MIGDADDSGTPVRASLMREVIKPVFIIGGSRTGSEMLKTMLSMSNELDFVDELFLICPRWLHRDLKSNIKEHVGDLAAPGAADRVVDLVFSGKPYGWFWTVTEKKLDRELLRAELAREGLSLKSIFRAIMVVHAHINRKSGHGAKFPLHYSHAAKLLEWFPGCRLIHTTRNPKAIYASQSAKYARHQKNALGRGFVRFQQFVHINLQISWTARLHTRLKDAPNYCLVRYEDVVLQPESELRRICNFVGAKFIPAMLHPHQYGSSFDRIGAGKGVDSSSLERWRTSVRPITAKAIDILHPFASKTFGY
jgi:hypothetical protein